MKMAESSVNHQELLALKIKNEMFLTWDQYSILSPSAYDTAWLAMIPHPHQPHRPMFPECLQWLLDNQNEYGFWGESHEEDLDLACLTAALACMVALKKWKVKTRHINKGLVFVHTNIERLLMVNKHNSYHPSWFTMVFPAMVELARAEGLELVFPEALQGPLKQIFSARHRILETEELTNLPAYSPIVAHLEALPASCDVNLLEGLLVQHQSEDGSLFQSPSATARMFMATGDKACMQYLQTLVNRCGNGVPAMYPLDEELMKLCMIDRLERLGLAEDFLQEIEDVLGNIYRNYMIQESRAMGLDHIVEPTQIYKDSLAFRLLRMHGYYVSPWRFCWFLCHNDVRLHIEENYECFTSAMLNVHRAADLMFLEEEVLGDARSFSRKILEKVISMGTEDNAAISPSFQTVIENELRLPWLARLDHLEHRMFIEGGEMNNIAPWMKKASFPRFSYHHNGALLQLAKEAYKFRQSIYKDELEKLTRWSKETGLSDMGFGREKTTYCYFAIAATTSLPCYSDVRVIAAKSAIIITVADDFFDMEGSLEELTLLTDAVKRWQGNDLKGHARVIFDVLDDLLQDVAAKFFYKQRCDITQILQDLWYHTFESWMTEARWSRSAYIPSKEEYLETGMTSIAAHVVILMASFFINLSLPLHTMKHVREQTITKLLMTSCRLLNDIQSYKKEQEDGKTNFVLLYMKDNPQADVDDSIAYVQKILEREKKDLLEHVLMDDKCDLPKSFKKLHLGSLKVFQMFFNSTNGFDSDSEMLESINKAIYLPIDVNSHLSSSSSLKTQKLNGLEQELSIKKAQVISPNSIHGSQRFRSSWDSRTTIQGFLSAGPKFKLPKISHCLI